ncbi:hypothetical protein LIER_31227 [Lithospermum erythrorhizon]|uniref:Uncharacterized protein n=1 Tax=Lithospermum erythrorhizon TaxID=34254 RepID=A0AAV3RTW9_LITER
MRSSRGGASFSPENNKGNLVLAHHYEGFNEICQALQRLPENAASPMTTCHRGFTNCECNPISYVGHRPGGPVSQATCETQGCYHGRRLFKQMGRGCSAQKHNIRGHRGIHIENHNH